MGLLVAVILLMQQSKPIPSSGNLTVGTTATWSATNQPELRCYDFCIERLSDEEVEKLAAAKKKMEEGEGYYRGVLDEVEVAHGAGNSSPCSSADTVEIRGKFALIQFQPGCLANYVAGYLPTAR